MAVAPRSQRLTIRDVAEHAGVSKAAASFALNGQPGVSAVTRQRILDIADELGWKPHAAARALGSSTSTSIGLVIARSPEQLALEPFFMEVVAGIERVLASGPYSLLLKTVDSPRDELEVYRTWAAERLVAGAILVDLTVDDPRPARLQELGVHYVMLGGDVEVANLVGASAICQDDAGTMRGIVDYLASLGHRSIAHVTGPLRLMHANRRNESFRRIAAQLGTRGTTTSGDFSLESGMAAFLEAHAAPAAPTAYIFDSDVMAVGGLTAARELGLAVPGDVSLVAWSGSPVCHYVFPTLTALERDVIGMAARVTETLLAQITGGASPSVIVQPAQRLVVGGSTGPAPTA